MQIMEEVKELHVLYGIDYKTLKNFNDKWLCVAYDLLWVLFKHLCMKICFMG